MSECCISGHIHEGTPEGIETEVAGVKTYIAAPADGSKEKTVLFIHDIFGYELTVYQSGVKS
jgi:dienelactone hydrolase